MDLELESSDNPRDYLLAIDDIKKPKVIDMSKIEPGRMNTAITCLARLIIMRKGTDPDRPNMGIDIVARYRFSEINELYTLQSEIEDQVTLFLPEFLPVRCYCSAVEEWNANESVKKIRIDVNLDGVMYQLLYNKEESKLEILQ